LEGQSRKKDDGDGRRNDGGGREGGRRGGETGKNSKSKKTIGIVFWNIAELKRKDRDFWDYLERYNG